MFYTPASMDFELIETETAEKFVAKGASLLEEKISTALSKTGRCILGLSGGATPLPIYRALKDRPLDWTNVWVFLTDERYVSPDHADSNQRALREALLDHVGLPPGQLIAPDTWKPLPECVHDFEQRMRELLAKGPPDIVTLGIGKDGHIASLFPPLPAEAFEGPLAIATHTDTFLVADRITVTMPVLLQAELPIFFLQGREKKRVWTKMKRTATNPPLWPGHSILATGHAMVIAEWGMPKKLTGES
jgi:6-phosphogluconolactonase